MRILEYFKLYEYCEFLYVGTLLGKIKFDDLLFGWHIPKIFEIIDEPLITETTVGTGFYMKSRDFWYKNDSINECIFKNLGESKYANGNRTQRCTNDWRI